MAGKISDLTAITGANLAGTDEIEVVDVSDTTMAATGTNKQTTLADLAASPPLTAGMTTHEAAADPHTGYVLQSDLATEVDALVTPLVAGPSITLSGDTIAVNRLFGRVTADITSLVNNSTTLADITGLSVTVEADATYELRGLLIYSAATAADLKLGFSTPAGVTGQWTALGMHNGATANTNTTARWQSQNDYTETNQLGAVGVGITSTSTRCTAFISGIVIVGSTAGTFRLRAAQQVADSSALAIGVGSYIVLERIA